MNISMPKGLYDRAKKRAKESHYASISELVRDALRWWLSDNLTVNGFTPEFEEEVLKAAAEPIENSIEWYGKGSFTDFVLSHPPKTNGKSKIRRQVLPNVSKIARGRSRNQGRSGATSKVVSEESGRYAAG